jgi:CPA2 family monovalent cation:H+ antiporter-2
VIFAVTENIQFIQDLAITLIAAGLAGWVTQKLGLSAVVGYLVAGILIGPHNSPLELIQNEEAIHTLSQLGLVFLLFWIGLEFSIRKLRRLGVQLILANLVAAVIIFNVVRTLGQALEFSEFESTFLAAMVLISSSAIISKVLHDKKLNHEKSGQLAMGVVIIEDALVVVLLTLLGSYVKFSGFAEAPLLNTVTVLIIFILLILTLGFFFIPRLLRYLREHATPELTTVIICGLLFIIAIFTVQAGYSLALGAFLLGAIISETPSRRQIEHLLHGTQNLFTAIFFTAIGMLIRLEDLPEIWHLILILTVTTVIFRFVGYGTGLLLIGMPVKNAVRTGLYVTPIGEFSFVIAGLGITAGRLPEKFYALAIGTCLLTAVIAPILARHSIRIGQVAEDHTPRWLERLLYTYRQCLDSIHALQQRSLIWQFSQKRILQTAREFIIVSGIILFSRPVYAALKSMLGPDYLFAGGTTTLFLALVILISAAPLVSLWRNLSAISLIYAEAIIPSQKQDSRNLRKIIETCFMFIVGIVIFIWLGSLLPMGALTYGALAVIIIWTVIVFITLRRHLIRLHSRFEYSMEEALSADRLRKDQKLPYLLDPHQDWKLNMIECQIPDDPAVAGINLDELDIRQQFGVSIIGIERQGFLVGNPRPETRLYPHDRLLLMGSPDQLKEAIHAITRTEIREHGCGF